MHEKRMNDLLNAKNVNAEIQKALNEGTDHLGGYTVPEIVSSAILEYARHQAQVAGIFETIPMTSDTYHLTRDAQGHTAYIVAEGAAITESSQSFVRATLTAKKFAAYNKEITTELLEDSNANIWAQIGPDMTKAIANKLDNEILEGDGTNFTGLLNASGVQTLAASGANGDTLSYKKIIQAKSKLTRIGITPTHLIAHPRDIDELEFEETTNGQRVLNIDNYGTPNVGENRVGRIKGIMIVESDQISIARTKGGSTDASNAYLINANRAGKVGEKRKVTMAKDYRVQYDDWEVAMTMRKAWTTFDPNAVCVIKDLVPS